MRTDGSTPAGPGPGWLSAMAAGRLGWTVRCTPRARTVRAVVPGCGVRYAKGRARLGPVAAELGVLGRLAALGFRVPSAFGPFSGHGAHWLGMEPAPGVALRLLWEQAVAAGGDGRRRLCRHALEVLGPWTGRLHRSGLVHRDLYGNHLFAHGLADEPTVIDVERVFHPRWRVTRWRLKDLAALWSSRPEGVGERAALAFLQGYLRGLGVPRSRRRVLLQRWLPHLQAKAERIRSRRPRFG